MPEWGIQVVLFLFGIGFLLSGIHMVRSNHPWSAVSVFGFATLLIGAASVGPSTITTLGAKWGSSGGQIGLDRRHQPTEQEREIALKLAQEYPSLEIRKEGNKFIKRAEERTPEQRSPEDYLALAAEKWRAKDYDAALADTFAGLALNPDNIRIKAALVNNKATIYHQFGLKDQGIKYYKEAIALDPKYALPYNNLGVLYQKEKKLKEAEAQYKKAIALDPKYPSPHHNLGNIYKKQWELKKAEAEYKRAIYLDPKYAAPHQGLGTLYREQGALIEAEVEFNKAIALDFQLAHAHNGLGNVYANQGKLKEAKEEYNKAIALDSKFAHAHNGLGVLYYKQENWAEAQEKFEEAVQLKPDYTLAKENLEILKRKMEKEK